MTIVARLAHGATANSQASNPCYQLLELRNWRLITFVVNEMPINPSIEISQPKMRSGKTPKARFKPFGLENFIIESTSNIITGSMLSVTPTTISHLNRLREDFVPLLVPEGLLIAG